VQFRYNRKKKSKSEGVWRMTGLDKMVNQILEEANNCAGAKIEEAKIQAEEILKQGRLEAEKEAEKIRQQSATDLKNYQERAKSSADLRRRTLLLQEKQAMIARVLDKAYTRFCSGTREEYFQVMLSILGKYVTPQEGILYFSDEDLKNLPAGYEEKIQQIAKEKGGSISISKESRKIEKGFILAYGGIEENCSFKALFDSRRDELQDKIQEILFS
jgi:V/A-type H+-transporting ATPase subunit E